MITESVIDLRQRGIPNTPGLVSVMAIPIEAVTIGQLFDLFNATNPDFEQTTAINSITIAAGYSWLNLANDFAFPMSLTETDNFNSPHGPLYSYSIKQEIPLDDYTTRVQIIRAWSRHEWVLVTTAVDGTIRLIGGINSIGAKFKAAYASGSQGKGPTKYILEMTWECSERAPAIRSPYSITGYTAGLSSIGFANAPTPPSTLDRYKVTFPFTPTSFQSTTGATISSITYSISFGSGYSFSLLLDGTASADFSAFVGGHGAGGYLLTCIYTLTDGSIFSTCSAYAVDGSGHIIASIQLRGSLISSVAGMTINETATVIITGLSLSVEWIAQPSGAFLSAAASFNSLIPIDTNSLQFIVPLISGFAFYTDLTAAHSVTIS